MQFIRIRFINPRYILRPITWPVTLSP